MPIFYLTTEQAIALRIILDRTETWLIQSLPEGGEIRNTTDQALADLLISVRAIQGKLPEYAKKT